MVITWRNDGPWGSGIGSDLTADQIDGNFWDHEQRIAVLEDSGIGVSIDFIEVDGNQMTIHMTDHSLQGPFTVPVATFRARGDWAAVTTYLANDIVANGGSLYLVLQDHTSQASFDPGYQIGGNNVYALLLSLPSNVIPADGEVGQVITKRSTTPYDVTFSWMSVSTLFDVAIISPINDGDVLTWSDSLNKWINSTVLVPVPDVGVRGGVEALSPIANNFVTGLGTDGILTVAQPAFSDLSGIIAEQQLLQTTHQNISQSGANITLDRSGGEWVSTTLTGNITNITFTGWPAAGFVGRIIWDITQGSGSWSVAGYPGSVKVANGASPPVISNANGQKDRLIFTSIDGGATVYLDIAGQNYG